MSSLAMDDEFSILSDQQRVATRWWLTTRSDFESFTGCLVDLAGSNSYLLSSPTNSLFGRHPTKSGHGFLTGFLNQPDLTRCNRWTCLFEPCNKRATRFIRTRKQRGNRIVGRRFVFCFFPVAEGHIQLQILGTGIFWTTFYHQKSTKWAVKRATKLYEGKFHQKHAKSSAGIGSW